MLEYSVVHLNDSVFSLLSVCVPVGNTLCKSGSIAVFGNVVYSGLLNEHLWHLGVPLFTRLVRAALAPHITLTSHTYLHFVVSASRGSVVQRRIQVDESLPAVSCGWV